MINSVAAPAPLPEGVDPAHAPMFRAMEQDAQERAARRKAREAGADAFKAEGNRFFKDGEYRRAADKYTDAIKVDPSNPRYYVNRAIAYIRLRQFTLAERSCDAALRIDEKHVKALVQRGVALRSRGCFDEGEESFLEARKHTKKAADRKAIDKHLELNAALQDAEMVEGAAMMQSEEAVMLPIMQMLAILQRDGVDYMCLAEAARVACSALDECGAGSRALFCAKEGVDSVLCILEVRG